LEWIGADMSKTERFGLANDFGTVIGRHRIIHGGG
jgi:hypothetical protein